MSKTIIYKGREIKGHDEEVNREIMLHMKVKHQSGYFCKNCKTRLSAHDKYWHTQSWKRCTEETIEPYYVAPNYTTSLDALRPVLAEIKARGLWEDYYFNLCELLKIDMSYYAVGSWNGMVKEQQKLMDPDPHVIAVACLITLEEGEE